MVEKAVEQRNEMVKRCQQLYVLFINCSGPDMHLAVQQSEDLCNLGTIRYSFHLVEGPLEKKPSALGRISCETVRSCYEMLRGWDSSWEHCWDRMQHWDLGKNCCERCNPRMYLLKLVLMFSKVSRGMECVPEVISIIYQYQYINSFIAWTVCQAHIWNGQRCKCGWEVSDIFSIIS